MIRIYKNTATTGTNHAIFWVVQNFISIVDLRCMVSWGKEMNIGVITFRNISSATAFSAGEAPWGKRSGCVSKAFLL
jgi:hypothetical protein